MIFFKTVKSFFRDKEYRSLLLTTSVIIAIGSVFYHFQEGWRWLDSVYFSIITLTTIGYGDFSPQTDMGKAFTMIYILIGVGIILSFVNAVYHHYNNVRYPNAQTDHDGIPQQDY